MKVVVCCPNCGCEDLELDNPSNAKWFKCLKCNDKFHIQSSGYNTKIDTK